MPSQTIRVYKPDKYATLYRPMLRDSRMSYGARGLLAFILSFPKGWEIRLAHLIKENPKGRDHVYGLLKELKKYKYLARARFKTTGGRFDWVTVISESPLPEDFTIDVKDFAPSTDFPYMENPLTDNPFTENPDTEKPFTENPSIYESSNNNLLNKDLLNKDLMNEKTTSSSSDSLVIDFSDTRTRIQLPDPFPVTDDMRVWASEHTPLVDLERETRAFMKRNYSAPKGDARATPPAYVAVPPSEWLRRWQEWMERGQKFAERDRDKEAQAKNGNGKSERNKNDRGKSDSSRTDDSTRAAVGAHTGTHQQRTAKNRI